MKKFLPVLFLCVLSSTLHAATEAVALDLTTHNVKNAIINFTAANTIDFTGSTVDFTGATVTGLSGLPTQSGHSGEYLTTNGTTASWAALSTAIPTGKTLWVDSVNGNDGTAVSGREDKPYLTISAAITAATSGDTVIVRPGPYDELIAAKNGVNIEMMSGATVHYTGSSSTPTFNLASVHYVAKWKGDIVDDGTGLFSKTFSFSPTDTAGNASSLTFEGNVTTGSIRQNSVYFNPSNANPSEVVNTVLTFRGDVTHSGSQPAIYHSGGTFRFTGSIVTTGSDAIAAYSGGTAVAFYDCMVVQTSGANAYASWSDSQASGFQVFQSLRSRKIIASNSAAIFWGVAAVTEIESSTIEGARLVDFSNNFAGDPDVPPPTGDLIIRAGELTATDSASTAIDWVANGGSMPTNTDQTVWIDANVIRCAGGGIAIRLDPSWESVGTRDHDKVYVTAQKLLTNGALPSIAVEDGRFWSNLDKLTSSNVFLALSGGQSWHDIRLLEVGTTSAQYAIDCSGGTHVIKNARFVGGASNKGVNVSGGTLILENCHIDTSANSSTNPITKSGGTLILKNCSLVAHSTRDSITAGTAQNVKIYGNSVANKAKHANITIQVGTLTVDANVL